MQRHFSLKVNVSLLNLMNATNLVLTYNIIIIQKEFMLKLKNEISATKMHVMDGLLLRGRTLTCLGQ